jgi:hypothetical protein
MLSRRLDQRSSTPAENRCKPEKPVSQEFGSDVFESPEPLSAEKTVQRRRSELRNGLTDRQRLFLFGKLSGLNDKNAALAAGYALSVAENTKQRIWKPQVGTEYERVRRTLT